MEEFANSMVTSAIGKKFDKKLKVKFTQNFLKIFFTFFNLRFFQILRKFTQNVNKLS